MNIAEFFGLGSKFASATETLFGIECEIESIRDGDIEGPWEVKPDGSLRNNGMEFVSLPQNLTQTVNAFQQLHSDLSFRDVDEKFSPRTSIHVHVNCKNLDEKHVRRAVLLYALFEEVFFLQVEPSRRDNIHCVALSDTHLPSRYSMQLADMVASWSKYTALNLKPLASLGTLEFRHSEGHDSPTKLAGWLQCIQNLLAVSADLEWRPETLSPENIEKLSARIFGHLPSYPSIRMRLFPLISNSLIDTKLSFN